MSNHGTARRRANVLSLGPVVVALAGALLASPAAAKNVFVKAEPYLATMPDGSQVTMWGYRVAPTRNGADTAPLASPGAAITVAADDPTLTVTLINALPSAPTSFVLHGHNVAMQPVFKTNATVNDAASAATDCVPGASLECRMRSFTHEVLPGAEAVYAFANVKPGTYLYQSGTLPQIQVQMGLYGMVRKNAAAGPPAVAYASPDLPFDNEVGLLLSEVDPALHTAVAAATFAGSTLRYDPRYFRVHRYGAANANGLAQAVEITDFSNQARIGAGAGLAVGQRNLIRVANAGIQSRALMLLDGHWYVVAEDGNRFTYRDATGVYPAPREQYSAFLPAAKTADLWFTPTIAAGAGNVIDRTLTVFDRRLALTNSNGDSAGGMLVRFSLGAAINTGASVDTTACEATEGTEEVPYTCQVAARGLGGNDGTPSFSLDFAPAGMTIDAGTGTIAWTPSNEQAQRPAAPALVNPVQVRMTLASGGYVTGGFTVTVGNTPDAPIAGNDAYDVRGGTLAATTSVLANDRDPDGDAFGTISWTDPAPSDGALTLKNADGTFTFVAEPANLPASGYRNATFAYSVLDATGLISNPATVTLRIWANNPPSAVDDVVGVVFAAPPVTAYVDVLANDYDSDGAGTLDVATLAIAGGPNRGGTASVVSGASCPVATRPCIAYTPAAGFRGSESVTYRVRDTLGALSNRGTLTVNIE